MHPSTGTIKKVGNPFNLTPYPEDEEDLDIDREPSWKTYRIKIKHICYNCIVTVVEMLQNNELLPLRRACICMSCGHRSIHQPYYRVCAMCSRLHKSCAMCCGPWCSDHIDPLEVILTPKMKGLIEKLPDRQKRDVHRFIFKKWDYFLKIQYIHLNEFQKEFRRIIGTMLNELEIKDKLNNDEKIAVKYEIINVEDEKIAVK